MFFSKYTIFSAFSHQTPISFKAHTSLKILTPAKPISLFVLVLLSSLVQAAEYQSHRVEGNKLMVLSDVGDVSITAYSGSAFEVFYQPQNTKQLPSFALVDNQYAVELNVKNTPRTLEVSTENLKAIINKSPLKISYYQGEKLLVEEEVGLFLQDTLRGFRFKLQQNEKLIGGGQRVLGMDRRGHRFPLYNKADYGYTTQSNQMYFGLSAVMSNRQYALIFDNSASGYMDLGYTVSDIMQFEAVGGRTAYVVIAGADYPNIIHNFVEITGKQPLPPRWALGNFASRFGYKTEQQTRETVEAFIDQDFPLDAVVLDLYWFGNDIKGFMGNLDWDKKTFPTPQKMMADFKAKGVKTVLITEPFILSSSDKWQEAVDNHVLAKNHAGEPRRFDFYFGNTGLIDVFDNKASDWFNDIYSDLFKQGAAGWWGDLGEPEVHPADSIHNFEGLQVTGDEIHNAYGHMWAKRVYENQRDIAPKQRPFIMMRSGFVGSQRYGMIPWTGDVSRSWSGLKPQVELSLQMGLLGLGYTHSDLGGFAGGDVFDQELYIRWLQYGVFQPVFRPHAQDNIAPEPIFHDKQTKDILREYVKLRYAMLPYNYSLAYENSLTGMPLMRPVFFEDPANDDLIDIKDSYFWGDAFLVKPITEPNLTDISIDLPQGVWFDYWTDKRYQGNQTIQLATQLDRLPVMVRGGSFIPMVEPVQSTDDYNTQTLQLHYYADPSIKSSSGTMYDDDGVDPDAIKNDAFETLLFKAQQQENQLNIGLRRQGQYQTMPKSRELTLLLHNWPKTAKVILINRKPINVLNDKQTFVDAIQAGYWDEKSRVLQIKFNWTEADLELEIK
ncbi:glycoside hydrolase family 31 protein [Paraglaciecola psychrophila]|uniref:Alpha-glucosidase n=1 Tax=Paraglaciecola psychrophila 170 TaxID=1129794 RepID=K6YYF9_9ALTE|nr:TIM-barrel domain-containing protein [Paraglaciecola psychrophila]AGH44731.1 alpha-glucosidase [Paraglaciecola psychrophila 170]GAC37769.1 alpha-glucosidase [Paraglaciecola psychrophila 170]